MSELLAVERRQVRIGDLPLAGGQVLRDPTLAFETYGKLAPQGDNAVLVTHGYTSSAHAAGRHAPEDAAPGWWDGVIGPGKAIDTERYFVVASNMIGSCYGSTGPASADPATGRPYGPHFPELDLADIVTAQRRLLARLGIDRLVAVAGVSYGGFQALQWGVMHPELMRGLVVVCSAPSGRGPAAVAATEQALQRDPRWNGGRYYETGGVFETMMALRLATLRRYGYAQALAASFPDPAAREAALRQLAADWARAFDANSLLVLGRAAARFDLWDRLGAIRAKLLYVLSTTDTLFPPTLAAEAMPALARAGVDAEYQPLESAHGHVASSTEPEKWAPALRRFLAALERKPA